MIYYISASGSSGNSGTTSTGPWDISKFTSFGFAPGDSILFKRGDSFTGTYVFAHSGTSGNPIIIDAYGYGNNPVFDAGGANSPILGFSGQSFITIKDIVLQNGINLGISISNGHDFTITNTYITSVSTGIDAVNCTGNIVIDSNYMLNMKGPLPRGQFVQFNNVSGAGNKITNNKLENIYGSSTPEDAISLYESNGTSLSPILVDSNQIEGGGPSTSGGGIMTGDSGGSYQTVSNNILVNPGQYGLAISSGDHISLINNKVYSEEFAWTNVGLYVWAQKGNATVLQPITNSTVSGNRVYWINKTGSANPDWLATGETIPAGWGTNVWQDATITAAILPNPLWTGTPWNTQEAVGVPAISYSPASYILIENNAISNISPTNTGGSIVSYAITPALPTGLNFDTSTGVISGTPTVLSANTSYAITATNTSGSSMAHISIQIKIQLPVISYVPSTEIYLLNTAITPISPSSTGGAVSLYAISPGLPPGLSLNTTTGAISGTPTALSPITAYTVTATNASGSTTAPITITVNTTSPNISYSPGTEIFTQGVSITPMVPVNTGGAVASYSISATLPAGLSFNTMTGVISGTPTALSSSTVYTITGTNITGSANTTVTITVNARSPVLSYVPSTYTFTQNAAITALGPTNTGGIPVSYSISASLSAGLSFNTATGVISGTPTALISATPYTVTATNTGGSGGTTVTISVVAPSGGGTIKKKRIRFSG